MPESEGSGGEHKHRTPSLALVPPSAYPMRERSPVPCAQPSPRGDAPSPLAFAKSCKGGDVSVLDPALAWDVRCIYLFIRECHYHHPGRGSRTAAPRTAPSVCSAAHQCAPRRRPATLAASPRTSSSTLEDIKVPSEGIVMLYCVLTGEKSPAKCFHSGRDSQVSMSEAWGSKRLLPTGAGAHFLCVLSR